MAISIQWTTFDLDTVSDILAEFLGLADDCDFEVNAVYVDSEFDDGTCLTLLQAQRIRTSLLRQQRWSFAVAVRYQYRTL